MREHPIPQDITNYRFHIIGSMTLKQFAEIFIGVIIAVFFYSTNLPDAIKWLFILLSVGLGAGAAFLPIEERPLDHWIITFIRKMYQPTKFFWERSPTIPEPFLYQSLAGQTTFEPEIDLSPAKRERIKEYLVSVNTPSEYVGDFTDWEASRIQQVSSLFETTPATAVASSAPKQVLEKPSLQVRVRSLRVNTTPVVKTPNEVTIYSLSRVADDAPIKKISFENAAIAANQSLTTTQPQQPKNAASIEVVNAAPLTDVPQNTPTEVSANTDNQPPSTSTNSFKDDGEPENEAVYMSTTPQPDQKPETPVAEAAFNADLPFPDPPTEANKLVGMVLTPDNQLITNAIVEIQNAEGQIVRAVKTNALGQFFVTTPLKNGDYVVSVEKNGFAFQPMSITLGGSPVAPLEIRSA